VTYQKFKLGAGTATPAVPNPAATVLPVPTQPGKVASTKNQRASLRQEMYAVQVRRLRQDVGKWRAALDRAESVFYPERVQLLNIYADLVLDLHLSSVIATRKISVTSRPFRLVDKAGKENVELTQLLKKPWFRQFMNHALDSIFWGFSVLEFPVPVEGEFQSVDLIDRQYIFPEAGMVRSMPGMITGVSYLEDPRFAPWVIAIGEPRDLGLLNKCAPVGLFKKNIMAAWADFTEVFGMPFRSVSTDAEGEELEEIENILANMGQSSYGVFPEDTEVKFIQAATANEQLYNVAIERFNSEMSKGILGQTMTTDNGSSKSQSEVHERVAASYTRDDAEWMAELINFTLLPFMKMHGYQVEGYRFEWDETESLGKEAQWKIVNEVLQRGYKVPAAYITATFGIPVELEAPADAGTGAEEVKPGPDGPSGGGGDDGQGPAAAGPDVKPILGYHIEAGVVKKNEVRAQLGLEAENDPEADRQQQLRGKLAVLAAATGAGIPLEAALKLAGLEGEVELPEAKPAPAGPAPGAGPEAPLEEEEQVEQQPVGEELPGK
jgi:hypothetical protein